MKYYNFYRESNNFDDILNDIVIKKYIETTITWKNYLRIGIMFGHEDDVSLHIPLKYGDELRNNLSKDFTPIPNVDYTPTKSHI